MKGIRSRMEIILAADNVASSKSGTNAVFTPTLIAPNITASKTLLKLSLVWNGLKYNCRLQGRQVIKVSFVNQGELNLCKHVQ